MTMVRRWMAGLGLAAALAFLPAPLAGQTPADTAAILADAARQAELEGHRELADELLRFIIRRYPGTPAARDAEQRLAGIRRLRAAGSGSVPLTVWNTLFGAWLGLAVPAALGANGTEPYGAGLLVGAPLGFIGTRAYARSTSVASGQATAIIFASQWGTFQAIGWREVLGIGDETFEFCNGTCSQYTSTPDEAPFAAAVVGGLAGLSAGFAIAGLSDPHPGRATLANHAAWWGVWYGFAGSVLADLDDDEDRLLWTLVGGNVGLLSAILAGRGKDLSGGRVRLASIAGVAGLVAGLGVDLLIDPSDDQVIITPPLVLSVVGLIAGYAATGDRESGDRDRRGGDTDFSGALLRLGRDPGVGFPTPIPTAIRTVRPDGRTTVRPGIRVALLDARF